MLQTGKGSCGYRGLYGKLLCSHLDAHFINSSQVHLSITLAFSSYQLEVSIMQLKTLSRSICQRVISRTKQDVTEVNIEVQNNIAHCDRQ